AEPHTTIGLLDFGDMVYAPLVIEVVIASNLRGIAADQMLEALCATVSAYDILLPLEEDEIDLIYDCLQARLAITAVIIAWRRAETPDQPAYLLDLEVDCWQTMRDLADFGRNQVRDRLRQACRFPVYCPDETDLAPTKDHGTQAIYDKRKQVLGQYLAHFYNDPVHVERGSGAWLYGADGRAYLDGYNNVPVVGHCHPHVVRAVSRQTAALNTHTRYLYSVIVEYAERLVATLPETLNVCTFVNSGSEANDIAWRMAKHVTGNEGAIVMEGAYHGITNAIKPLSPSRANRPNPSHVKTLKCPDLYRESLTVEAYAADVDRAIAELAADGIKPACFMLDSLFVSNGSPTIPAGYVAAVVERVRAAGGIFIADEVQAGFARSGDEMWGHKLHGVTAEFVTMGKPIGSGYPLGAIVTSAEILNSFVSEVGLFSTFGGNPVACAAGLAVLEVLQKEGLQTNAKETGAYLRAGIRNLMPRHALIGDVRGQGLMAGVELVRDRDSKTPAAAEAKQLINLMRAEQVLISTGGMLSNVLKIRPPLVFQKEHADIMIAALDKSLAKLR
ncbi:MAG: aminotransferase class III-fold pyridoxal phosphate-dependent enzyme, partial [Candidatus Promineifilaceae bacterium]